MYMIPPLCACVHIYNKMLRLHTESIVKQYGWRYIVERSQRSAKPTHAHGTLSVNFSRCGLFDVFFLLHLFIYVELSDVFVARFNESKS